MGFPDVTCTILYLFYNKFCKCYDQLCTKSLLRCNLCDVRIRIISLQYYDVSVVQGTAERTPLFGKLINSKPKKDTANVFFLISGKYTECRFTSTCFEQNITQVAALNIDTLM